MKSILSFIFVLCVALMPSLAGAQAISAAAAIIYHLEAMPKDLKSQFSETQIALLEKLNRADAEHLQRLKKLIVPSQWNDDELAYSPVPRTLAQLSAYPKALIVHQPLQFFAAYENGQLVHWGPVSSGRRQMPTPSGLFHLNWKSIKRASTEDPAWILKWYFNFHNTRGVALHEFALPGRPASHACVRLLERDAHWVYDWGEGWVLDATGREILQPGTPIWVIGNYNFDAAAPWLNAKAPHPSAKVVVDVGR